MKINGRLQVSYRLYGSTDVRTILSEGVISMSDNISASVSLTPIVTYTAENAFAFDTSATESVNMSLVRVQPSDWVIGDDTLSGDSLKWSNQFWKEQFTAAINRWQARTDGCTMRFIPTTKEDGTASEFQLLFERNAYIQNISFSYTKGEPSKLTASLTFQVGSMWCDSTPTISAPKMVDEANMCITMKSSDQISEYVIYRSNSSVDMNCVTEYTLKGGMEQPFESLTMKISKKRLTALAPYLVDDIKPGSNIIHVNAVGEGSFIVTKCSTSGQYYKVVAYSIAEQYKGCVLGDAITFGGTDGNYLFNTPFGIIQYLLTGVDAGVSEYGAQLNFQNRVRYCFRTEKNKWTTEETSTTAWNMQFEADTTFWYALSVCALRLHAKLWFSEGYAYIIDPSVTESEYNDGIVTTNYTTYPFEEHSTIYLNKNGPYPISISAEEEAFIQSVVNSPSLGDEGSDVIKNTIGIKYKDTKYATSLDAETELVKRSREIYKEKSQVYEMKFLCYEDALAIANNIADMNCDAEQSITFGVKEMHENTTDHKSKWVSYFSPVTRAGAIVDYSNDLRITNKCNYQVNGSYPEMPQKLCLSTYNRHFPQGYTEYTFGVIAPTDLSQSTSQILTALNN